MPDITTFSVNNSRVTIFFLTLVLLAGISFFIKFPRAEDPAITIREAVVTAAFPGMSTERVEDLITRKLEETIREIGEVDEITSDSKTGVSIVHVVARDEIPDVDAVWQELRNKMDDVKSELPSGTVGPVVNDEFGLTAIATIALWADGFTLAEMWEVARDLRDRLYTVAGVRKIEIFGIQEERIYLELDNAQLAQLGMSPSVIVQTLIQQNIILPGGRINASQQEIIAEPSGNFDDVVQIEDLILPIPGTSRTISLKDIARITRENVDPPDKPVYFKKKQAIVLSVSILDGFNSVEFGDRLNRKIHEEESLLPFGYFLDYATFQPPLVEAAVGSAVTNVYQSLVIVLAVVIIFLGFRTGLIVGSFVPMAMLLGLVVMWFADIQLQRMSIATMIIALGLLVDNGIVVAEDIKVRMEGGQDRKEAAISAGKSLSTPLLISSLTTIFAFAPMMLISGGTGEYVFSLGAVIAIVLLASWFLAMFMTPAMCVWFMKVKPSETQANGADRYDTRVYRSYKSFLTAMLNYRTIVIAILVSALVASGWAFRFVVQEFFPNGDRNQFLIYLDLPAGTRVDKTAEQAQQLAGWLNDKSANPEIVSTVTYVGSGGPRFFLSLSPFDPDPHLAFIVANTVSSDQVGTMIERTRQYALDNFADARARVKAMWLGGAETGIFEVRINGPDPNVLFEKAKVVQDALRAISGTIDLKQDWENLTLKIAVEIDQARARRAGVTSQEVANSLNASLDGARITDYREGDTVIPVVIRGSEDVRTNIANLRSINVYSAGRGVNVPLAACRTEVRENGCGRIAMWRGHGIERLS